MDAAPYTDYDIVWEGDGPSNSGADSDAIWGENNLVATGFSVQPLRVFWAPRIPTFIDMSETPGYPGAESPAAILVATGAAFPNALYGDYTERSAGYGYGEVYLPDAPLAAPQVPTGDSFTRGR